MRLSVVVITVAMVGALVPGLAGTAQAAAARPAGSAATRSAATSTTSSSTATPGERPVIARVSPRGGPAGGGGAVTVTGRNLSRASTVRFGSIRARVIARTASTLTVLAPAHASGAVAVMVRSAAGVSAPSNDDQYVYAAPAAVAGFAPRSGTTGGGTTVTVFGTGFLGTVAVEFGSRPARSFRVRADDVLTAVSPAGAAGSVPVTLISRQGARTSSRTARFALLDQPSPAGVSAASPARTPATPWSGRGVASTVGPVTAPTATPGSTDVELAWTNPTSSGLVGVMIRRSRGATAPASPTAGTLVTNVAAPGNTFVDTRLSPGTTYSYALFAYDATPSYAAGADVTTMTTTTGQIAGTVTAATGGGRLAGVTVVAFDATGDEISSAETAADGTYALTQLPSTTQGYLVCFQGAGATGGSSEGGYLDQCWKNVPWSDGYYDFAPPSASTPVAVKPGTTTRAINAALASGGAVSGTVSASSGGAGLANVAVDVFGGDGTLEQVGYTDENGNYTVDGVEPSSVGASVCFDAGGASGGPSSTGYVDQCYDGVAYAGGDQPPPDGTQAVPITAGTTASGIGASLATGGGLAGTVTAAGGMPLEFATVSVFDSTGDQLVDAGTNSDGTYSALGLPPSTSGYDVCFDGNSADNGTSATGYVDQCYRDVTWNGQGPPATANTVSVTAGELGSGIDAVLAVAGAITGHVTDSSKNGLEGVFVELFDPSGNYVSSTDTYTRGAYTLTGLPASSAGYSVCFDASYVSDVAVSYQDQCYRNQPWNAAQAPSTSTTVVVKAGSTKTAINAALAPGANISGTVTDATSGSGVYNVGVEAYDASGNYLGSAYTDLDGDYAILGLAAASADVVCFDASFVSGGEDQSQCYQDIAWSGGEIPTGTTPVALTTGATTTGIDAALSPAPTLTGTVTDGSGNGIAGVSVSVDDQQGDYFTSETGSDGSYTVTGPVASSVSYTVCFDTTQATGGSSTTGYADQCYKNVPWNESQGYPAGTTPVTVGAAGASGIDALLAPAAAITGRVTAATGGGALADVQVIAYDLQGDFLGDTSTTRNGAYTLAGLVSSGPVDVCFNGALATGPAATGYVDQCYKNVPWSGGQPPPDATSVKATVGHLTKGVDDALQSAAAIAGSVTGVSGGGPVAGVYVDVQDAEGDFFQGSTAADGSYLVGGLAAPAGGYTVCFDASDATGADSSYGLADQCYEDVPWDDAGGPPASGANPVMVTLGSVTSGIDAALTSASAISGTVTDASGEPVSEANVTVYDASGDVVGFASTGDDGSFQVSGLTPTSSGDDVCFDPVSAVDPDAPTGLLAQCYRGVAWQDDDPVPAAATAVALTAGAASTGISATLETAGAISGTVTAATGGAQLAYAVVEVYDAHGDYLGQAISGANGAYIVTGLAASTADAVCVAAPYNDGGAPSYASECDVAVPWNPGDPVPTSAAHVKVKLGATTKRVNVALPAGGSISGTVTVAQGGAVEGGAFVEVFDASGQVGYATTAADGTYTVSGLAALAPGYKVCVAPPTTTLTGECYQGVAWNPGGPVLGGAQAVAVAAGASVTGVNVALGQGGSIAVTTTAANGSALGDVAVEVFDSSGAAVVVSDSFGDGYDTSPNGMVTVPGLAPSSAGYTVCFDATHANSGSSGSYDSACYRSIAWDPSADSPPPGTLSVPVTAGGTATISELLQAGS